MTAAWSPQQLEQIGRAEELEIAARRADGTLRRRLPIWAVCVGEHHPDLRANVDATYRVKYEHYGVATVDRMVTDAAAATLRLIPERGAWDRL